MIESHEDGVEHDAERDEEVDEGIHDEELDVPRHTPPAGKALPAEQKEKALGPRPALAVSVGRLEIQKSCKANRGEGSSGP